MQAGKLSESFAFDKRISEDDGAGNTVSQWQEQFTTAANCAIMRGGETVMAARLQGRQPVIVTVRRFSFSILVTADWRCRDRRTGRVYNIRSVQPSQKRDHIEFLCEAGVAHG